MMLFQLLSDPIWKNTSKGFRRPKGKVVWKTAEMSRDGRRRIRVTRKQKNARSGLQETIVGYLRPHAEVELVPKSTKVAKVTN